MENEQPFSATRTSEDIKKVLHLAKLNENDILPTSQVIYFPGETVCNYTFLELTEDLLKTLNEGSSLYIKGDDHENAVICTDSQTYDVTETETSNSLLLVKNLKFAKDLNGCTEAVEKVTIQGIFYDYLEPSLSKPRLEKLHRILEKSVYKGPEYEIETNENDFYEFDDLLNVIQASRLELVEALKMKQTITINKKIRILEFGYHFRVLSYMLKLLDENSWNLDEVDFEETVNTLNELVPDHILYALFNIYTEESKIIDGVQLYRYKEAEVCKFFAQVLLSNASKFNFNEFMEAWRDSVPDGMVPTEEMLYGIAIIDRRSHPHTVCEFLEEKLPENINERFNVLFDLKEKWTVAEIAPYLIRLTNAKLDVNALLAKYARASTVNGVKYYSGKHVK